MILELIRKKVESLKKLAETVRQNIKVAPEGSLMISKGKKKNILYRYLGEGKKKPIRKDEPELARALAQKDYDIKVLRLLDQNIADMEKAMKILSKEDAYGLYKKLHPERQKLVTPYDEPVKEKAKKWQALRYEGKSFDSNPAKYRTKRGEFVRSKSELIIADRLYSQKIPYRYEYPYYMNELGTVFPDFTVMNPNNGREYILEHFGMLDDPGYLMKALNKISIYSNNGFIVGYNFIFTYETKGMPLDVRYLDRLIKKFLTDY